MENAKRHVLVCVHERPPGHPRGSCRGRSGAAVFEAFAADLQRRSLLETVRLTYTGCLGPCAHGANVLVYPEGVLYGAVTASDVSAIVDGHLVGDAPVDRLRVPDGAW